MRRLLLPGLEHSVALSASRPRPAQVRIVGGQWRRTLLSVVDVPGLRPTPDRVRETLFNWLGQSLGGWSCLDLFAGTGALGLEAASRGAERVVLVESHRTAAIAIRAAIVRLKAESRVSLIEGDAMTAVAALLGRGERFDLILLDPPFRQAWIERVTPRLPALLNSRGLVYVEAEHALASPEGFESLRHGRAGEVHYHLWRSLSEASLAGVRNP